MNARAMLARQLYALCLFALFALSACAQTPTAAESLDRFPQDTLTIATSDARLHHFKIWIAAEERRQAQGLMFIKELAADRGMLFIYPTPRPIAMWMKNTYISLDMLFIRADGRVARVASDTKPLSLETIESGEPVLAVLELPAGTARHLNIRPGSLVMHAFFSGKLQR